MGPCHGIEGADEPLRHRDLTSGMTVRLGYRSQAQNLPLQREFIDVEPAMNCIPLKEAMGTRKGDAESVSFKVDRVLSLDLS